MNLILIKNYLVASLAALVHLLLSFSPVISAPNWNLSTFKIFGSSDQLSYLAIAKNFSQGEFDLNEPYTETGNSYYPSFYYIIMGIFMRLFRLNSFEAWNLLGALVQFILVFAISMTLIKITKRTWVGILGFLPLYFGVFGFLTEDMWKRKLDSHATLWGSFPTMFVMNAETFAIALVSIGFLIVIANIGLLANHKQNLFIPLAFLGVGLLANIHIYTFITALYLIFYAYAFYILINSNKLNISIYTSSFFIVFAFLIADPFSLPPLLITFLGLIPALAIGLIGSKYDKPLLIRTILPLILGSSYAVVSTIIGLLNQEPFLIYRQDSAVDLNVNLLDSLSAGLALVLPLGFLIVYFYLKKDLKRSALLSGFLFSWIVLSQNQIWNMNQEPYRFWIISFIIISIILFPLLIKIIVESFQFNRNKSLIISFMLALPLILSMVDSYNFHNSNTAKGIFYYDIPQNKALQKVSRNIPQELIAIDSCLDPSIYKIITGRPVAYFNEGMVWPKNYFNIKNINTKITNEKINAQELKANNVQYFISESNCQNYEEYKNDSSLIPVNTVNYESGNITLFSTNLTN